LGPKPVQATYDQIARRVSTDDIVNAPLVSKGKGKVTLKPSKSNANPFVEKPTKPTDNLMDILMQDMQAWDDYPELSVLGNKPTPLVPEARIQPITPVQSRTDVQRKLGLPTPDTPQQAVQVNVRQSNAEKVYGTPSKRKVLPQAPTPNASKKPLPPTPVSGKKPSTPSKQVDSTVSKLPSSFQEASEMPTGISESEKTSRPSRFGSQDSTASNTTKSSSTGFGSDDVSWDAYPNGKPPSGRRRSSSASTFVPDDANWDTSQSSRKSSNASSKKSDTSSKTWWLDDYELSGRYSSSGNSTGQPSTRGSSNSVKPPLPPSTPDVIMSDKIPKRRYSMSDANRVKYKKVDFKTTPDNMKKPDVL